MLTTAIDEASLIASAQRGDERAFETLLAQYRSMIAKVCYPYFLPGADADDVRSEARVGFFKAMRDFRPDNGAFNKFAELVVRRNVITALKHATRQKSWTLNKALSLDAPLTKDSDMPRNLGDVLPPVQIEPERDADLAQVVKDAIVDGSMLSDFEATVLLAYFKGFTYAEIAQSLGKSFKAVDNASQRTKLKVNDALRKAVPPYLAQRDADI